MEWCDLKRSIRFFFSVLLLGAICYATLIFLGQRGDFGGALRRFPLEQLPLLLALASVNYLLRYFRWQIYVRLLGINISWWRSFQVFMAGLSMTVTPGKAGEALKAHLLTPETDQAWSAGLPAVFAERLTDLMGVVILVTLGLGVMPYGKDVAALGIALCLALFVICSRPIFFRALVRLLAKLPRMAERSRKLITMYTNVQKLLSLRLLLVSLSLSVAAWYAECLVLYFALVSCGSELTIIQSTFIYSLSTLVGALSMLPGGLIVTEGSMGGLLVFFGIPMNQSSLVTLVVRLCTLWFAVFVGMFFVGILQMRQHFSYLKRM